MTVPKRNTKKTDPILDVWKEAIKMLLPILFIQKGIVIITNAKVGRVIEIVCAGRMVSLTTESGLIVQYKLLKNKRYWCVRAFVPLSSAYKDPLYYQAKSFARWYKVETSQTLALLSIVHTVNEHFGSACFLSYED